MTRRILLTVTPPGLLFAMTLLVGAPAAHAQLQERNKDGSAKDGSAKSDQPAAKPGEEQEPPEEDADLKPKEYAFNPLEAQKNVTAGNFYFKKGNYRAASRRYEEATKWDPSSAEALSKLGEADEKLRNFDGARDAYTKYLALDPPGKESEAIKKRLEKLPKATSKKR